MIEQLWKPPTFDTHPGKPLRGPRRGLCVKIEDGDTFDVMVEMGIDCYRYTRIRLAVVDCPEIFHPKSDAEKALGLKAKAAVAALLLNRPVMVDFGSEQQIQGRMIAHVAFSLGGAPALWQDLGGYLTDQHLLKKDVTP